MDCNTNPTFTCCIPQNTELWEHPQIVPVIQAFRVLSSTSNVEEG
jgi:hypothetical protein